MQTLSPLLMNLSRSVLVVISTSWPFAGVYVCVCVRVCLCTESAGASGVLANPVLCARLWTALGSPTCPRPVL